MDDEVFRPWGIVTPEYWVNGSDRSDVGGTTVVPQQEFSGAGEAPSGLPGAHAGVDSAVLPVQTPLPVPQGSALPSQSRPPKAYLERINSIVAAFGSPDDRTGLAAATIEAEALDRELTAKYGQPHPYVIGIRELRGWLALLLGEPDVAARWYLHTTGLQIALRGATHTEAEGSARRAVHTWQQVKDPADVVQIGLDLAKVVTAVLGEDSDAASFIRARVARYEQPTR
ncbi:hypothetical protein ACWCQM_36695 [Streptomyces sp. NPDC002125]